MTQTYYDIVEISQRRMSVVLASHDSHRQKLAGTGSISSYHNNRTNNMSTSGNLNDETDVKAFKKMVECAETSKPSKIATRSSSKDSTAVASCSGTSSGNKTTPLNILSLNDDVFQAILSHLTYDEVAKSRLVCRHFNDACQKVLNKGFLAVQRYHSRCLKEMKAKLPRRESERRTHPLARHIDVLTGIETRLSLLSMTYYKYTVLGVFCFIPGKVLDECYRVLREVIVHKNPPKSYELLQELRDISSMAMEHFEEHIVPTIKRNQMLAGTLRGANQPTPNRPFSRLMEDQDSDWSESLLPSPSGTATMPSSPTAFIRAACNANSNSIAGGPPPTIRMDLVVQQNRQLIFIQRKQIVELKNKLTDYGRKILEQDKLLNDYGRKLIQLEQKLSLSLQQQPPPVPPPVTVEPGPSQSTPKRKRKDAGEDPKGAKRTKTSAAGSSSATNAFSMSLRNRSTKD